MHSIKPRKFMYWWNKTDSDASDTNQTQPALTYSKFQTCEMSCRSCCLYC